MLKNKDIICISSIDWDFIWQGHQEIMTRLARNGNRVLYIENTGVRSPKLKDIKRITSRLKNFKKGVGGFRQIENNLFVFSPIVIPFPYSKAAQVINTWFLSRMIKRWMESISFYDPIIWTFIPTQLTINLIREIKNKLVVYYCIDSFVDSSDGAKGIVDTEETLFKISDLVFVTSHTLMDKASRFNKEVYFFPFAVNLDNFNVDVINNPLPPFIKGEYEGCSPLTKGESKGVVPELKGIKIGYIGGIHKWIDFNLIADIAEKKPEWTFLMVGPLQTDTGRLTSCKNVLFLGAKGHKELPSIINQFDICIIPYIATKYTENVYPTKLTEYLAMGKPVISSPILEMEIFDKKNPGIIKFAADANSFINAAESFIKEGEDEEKKRRRIEAAKENTWDNHIYSMSNLIIDKTLEKEKGGLPWHEQFKLFYYRGRWKAAKYMAYLLLLWIILFHTPILWITATPLLIEEKNLGHADAIVALGGGVGESGEAGQGYIERTEKSIEIYKNGMADKVLFMSGYIYIMREAEMMRALGIEYGIPEDKILIDISAHNTYTSAKRLGEIAKERGWESLIIISSPYHMKRISLCMRAAAPWLKARYTPVNQSIFYGWPKKFKLISYDQQITTEQIKGLLHEVIGIGYYWYKGYLG